MSGEARRPTMRETLEMLLGQYLLFVRPETDEVARAVLGEVQHVLDVPAGYEDRWRWADHDNLLSALTSIREELGAVSRGDMMRLMEERCADCCWPPPLLEYVEDFGWFREISELDDYARALNVTPGWLLDECLRRATSSDEE